MSTGLEALRAPRRTPWTAVVLAFLIGMTVVVIVTTASISGGRPDARFVGRHLVNTPTEISGGVIEDTVSGAAANTPSELRGVAITESPRTADAISGSMVAAEHYD